MIDSVIIGLGSNVVDGPGRNSTVVRDDYSVNMCTHLYA